jgi:hypothetical protein
MKMSFILNQGVTFSGHHSIDDTHSCRLFNNVIHFLKETCDIILPFGIFLDVSEDVEVSTSLPANIGRNSRTVPAGN